MSILLGDSTPTPWPKETEESYERIEALGRGSFGKVWLAKKKKKKKTNNSDKHEDYVAIKIADSGDPLKKAFAQREMCILTELDHPHIMKLIESTDFIFGGLKSVLVMSFANGPNLDHLRRMRGALGLPLCRLIARQLISAVSYLHGRAVIHRDIKPANVILSRTAPLGAGSGSGGPPVPYSSVEEFSTDSLIFDDGVEGEEAVNDGRWKIVLVDFGFARALTPEEVYGKEGIPKDITERRRSSKFDWSISNEGTHEHSENLTERSLLFSDRTLSDFALTSERLTRSNSIDEEAPPPPPSPPPQEAPQDDQRSSPHSLRKNPKGTAKWSPFTTRRKQMSFSRKHLAMSAIGTKGYTAPEIKHMARDKLDNDRNLTHEALTEIVADYGMICDAYSVGVTLREVLTGVPGDHNIADYIASKTGNSIMDIFLLCRGNARKRRRRRRKQCRYRYFDDLPKVAVNLVRSLTRADIYQRISVREAQRHAWIEGGVANGEAEGDKYDIPQGDVPSTIGHPVIFLECAKKQVEHHS